MKKLSKDQIKIKKVSTKRVPPVKRVYNKKPTPTSTPVPPVNEEVVPMAADTPAKLICKSTRKIQNGKEGFYTEEETKKIVAGLMPARAVKGTVFWLDATAYTADDKELTGEMIDALADEGTVIRFIFDGYPLDDAGNPALTASFHHESGPDGRAAEGSHGFVLRCNLGAWGLPYENTMVKCYATLGALKSDIKVTIKFR